MIIKRNPLSLRCPLPNKWYQLVLPDDECIGTFIQNQDAVADFWICPFEPSSLTQAQWFPPGGAQYDDRIPWQDALWVYCDTANVALTFFRIYGTPT